MGDRSSILRRVVPVLAGVVVLKVTAAVVLGYRNYFPPDFESEFLRGREGYFWGGYQWAFYPHLASGPVSLVLGVMLISERFRLRYPKWHRYLGRIQGACVLLGVCPSGLWMAYYAAAGPVAAVGFSVLAVLTGTCLALGWRAAVRRRFAVHRRWMWRTFLLLCSAVVLRVVVGAATVLEVGPVWFDPAMAWAGWLVPLAAYELGRLATRRVARPRARAVPAGTHANAVADLK